MAEVLINGIAGRIEGKYHQSGNRNAPIALVLHPHPEFGGTMNNKVVYSTYKTFAQYGFNVLRFNFRGVGRSEGVFDHGEGELNDAATALDWLQSNNPNAPRIMVAGFSFGSWIAMHLLMRRPEIDDFIAISPPADKYDFSFVSPCPVSGIIIQGTSDELVKYQAVEDLAQKLKSKKGININYHPVEGADHFYTKHMSEFETVLSDYVKNFFLSQRKVANFK